MASTCKPNLVQIDPEIAEMHLFMYFQMAAVRHLGFVLPQFWTVHDVPLDTDTFSLLMA